MGLFTIALKNIFIQKGKSIAFFLTISLSVSIILLLFFISFGIRASFENTSSSLGYSYSIKMKREQLNMIYRGIPVGQEEVRDLPDIPGELIIYLEKIPRELEIISLIFRRIDIIPFGTGEVIVVGEYSPGERNSDFSNDNTASAGYYFTDFDGIPGSVITVPGKGKIIIGAVLEKMGTEEDNVIFYTGSEFSDFELVKLNSRIVSAGKIQDIIYKKFPDNEQFLEIVQINNENNLRFSFLDQFVKYSGYIVTLMAVPVILLFNVFGISLVRGREREIAVFRAVGFKKKDIGWLVFIELTLISSVSVCAGVVLSLPMAMSIQISGILPGFSFREANIPLIIGSTFFAALGIFSISGIIPVIKAAKMDPVDAFRTL